MSEAPKYASTILCLANSKRPGGRCVAGKVFDGGKIGAWLRPVNVQNGDAISEADAQYEDGSSADLLDIVKIQMIGATPHNHHKENHEIHSGYYWEKQGRATWDQVTGATDNVDGPLWPSTESSFHGKHDKVPEAEANALPNSLLLIQPTRLDLVVAYESMYGGGSKRKVRADFTFKGVDYNFVVTDPWIETKYFAGNDGVYRVNDARLCVSLAAAYNGIATKLAAAVITKDRVS